MTTTRRVLTALAATALLTVGAAALAAPAQADVHVNILGGIAIVDTNGTIDVGAGGATILSVPNVLNPLL
ncbi:hypothetical protein [Streptomyces albireticuli]|uniref:Amidohydrolase n=1 Tax=Streptomyces albireticuli TaxID=1940 RepID=A0A2A2D6R4_9ACTN|nr:hypothetical protein [Streptomyces albireticuli]MCD9143053.1 hypothetical protein [Streptomyces albireticuli]MCD9165296.1 hypothetical protein [Streptomyces albireticuli]MCD9192186.1 hypothetical protein [Streptomyces albireticuli]PAU48178.1 hypothetical protein CK936_14755 [Streptomyces albireticuli]